MKRTSKGEKEGGAKGNHYYKKEEDVTLRPF